MKSQVLAFTLLSLLAIGARSPVRAQSGGDAAVLNASQSMGDNLRHLAEAKKTVELVLRNGKSYKGKLGAVGDHSVVVTQIAGRDFFDALVLIDEVVAVEVQARDH
jgi:uncharacterized protein (DUF608 family)